MRFDEQSRYCRHDPPSVDTPLDPAPARTLAITCPYCRSPLTTTRADDGYRQSCSHDDHQFSCFVPFRRDA